MKPSKREKAIVRAIVISFIIIVICALIFLWHLFFNTESGLAYYIVALLMIATIWAYVLER